MNLSHYWTVHWWLNLSPVSSRINEQCFSLFWQVLIADRDCSLGSFDTHWHSFTPLIFSLFNLNSMWLCTVIMLNVVNVELWSRVFYPVSLWFFMGGILKSQRSTPTVCLQKKRPLYLEMLKTTSISFKFKSSVNESKITYHPCRKIWPPSQCLFWFSTLNRSCAVHNLHVYVMLVKMISVYFSLWKIIVFHMLWSKGCPEMLSSINKPEWRW